MKNLLLFTGLSLSLTVNSQNGQIETSDTTLTTIVQTESLSLSGSGIITSDTISMDGCQRCEQNNCITVNRWWGSGAYNKDTYYTQVVNNSNQTVTYKVCVLKKTGYWDCGTDQVGPYATDSQIYYSNADPSGQLIYYAAYGDWINQECKFPNPN